MQSGEPKTPPAGAGRANQKLRTRNAIVRAATDLMRTGRDITMLEVAKAALVSEATAYRYFPDLTSLLREAMDGQMPTPAEALAAVADSDDPVERVAAATAARQPRTPHTVTTHHIVNGIAPPPDGWG
jgi:AcrR family transcriptional regulator